MYNYRGSDLSKSRLVTAQLNPLPAGPIPELVFWADADQAADVEIELRTTSDPRHQSADVTLDRQTLPLGMGNAQKLWLRSQAVMPRNRQSPAITYCRPTK